MLPDGEPIHTRAKYSALSSMCDFPDKDMKFPKWSCVLNCCSECPGVFVTHEEINCEEGVNLPLICFCHYLNISSFYFHKQLFFKHVKICTLYVNL